MDGLFLINPIIYGSVNSQDIFLWRIQRSAFLLLCVNSFKTGGTRLIDNLLDTLKKITYFRMFQYYLSPFLFHPHIALPSYLPWFIWVNLKGTEDTLFCFSEIFGVSSPYSKWAFMILVLSLLSTIFIFLYSTAVTIASQVISCNKKELFVFLSLTTFNIL